NPGRGFDSRRRLAAPCGAIPFVEERREVRLKVGNPRSTIRRRAVGLVVALVIALVAPALGGIAGAAGGGSVQDLSGTWTAQDGVTWTFTANSTGSYTAVYHGTGAHAK